MNVERSARRVEGRLKNDICEKALKTIEETFGTRFVWHVDGLSATTDIELVRLAGRSWMPQQP